MDGILILTVIQRNQRFNTESNRVEEQYTKCNLIVSHYNAASYNSD